MHHNCSTGGHVNNGFPSCRQRSFPVLHHATLAEAAPVGRLSPSRRTVEWSFILAGLIRGMQRIGHRVKGGHLSCRRPVDLEKSSTCGFRQSLWLRCLCGLLRYQTRPGVMRPQWSTGEQNEVSVFRRRVHRSNDERLESQDLILLNRFSVSRHCFPKHKGRGV
jgi:hypothetical protein